MEIVQYQKMDQFQVIEEIGTGSFGQVLKVKKRKDGAIYAMKQIKIKELSFKEKNNALNEIRLLASIESQNVIEYKGAFFDGSQSKLCMVMQFAEGGDLSDLIKRKKEMREKIKQQFIWKISYDILRGIKTLHQNSIIHRDIKAGNVFLVNGVAKIGDMNVSKVLQGKFTTTTAGTPFYISPEIWNGKKYDSKCDIWSFGCLLYELCMFKPPFTANDFSTLIRKVKTGYYEPLHYSYSKKLGNLIRRCLTIDPTKRPSAQQLLKMQLFKKMSQIPIQDLQGSFVELLDTIVCPKILSSLNQHLPNQKTTKRVITMKNMPQIGNQDDYQQFASKRVHYEKTKKFASERFICEQEIYRYSHVSPSPEKKQNSKWKVIEKLKSPLPVKRLRIRLIPKCQSKKKLQSNTKL